MLFFVHVLLIFISGKEKDQGKQMIVNRLPS